MVYGAVSQGLNGATTEGYMRVTGRTSNRLTSTKFLFYRRGCRYADKFERRLYAAFKNYSTAGVAYSDKAAKTTGAEFYDVIIERVGLRSSFCFSTVKAPMPMVALADDQLDEELDCPTFKTHDSDLYLFKACPIRLEAEKQYDVAMTCRDPAKFDTYMDAKSKIESAGMSCILLVRGIPFDVRDENVIKYVRDDKATKLTASARVWHHPADGVRDPYEEFSNICNCFLTTDRANGDLQFLMKTHAVRDVSELAKAVELTKDEAKLDKAMWQQSSSGLSWMKARKDRAARKLMRDIDECLKTR